MNSCDRHEPDREIDFLAILLRNSAPCVDFVLPVRPWKWRRSANQFAEQVPNFASADAPARILGGAAFQPWKPAIKSSGLRSLNYSTSCLRILKETFHADFPQDTLATGSLPARASPPFTPRPIPGESNATGSRALFYGYSRSMFCFSKRSSRKQAAGVVALELARDGKLGYLRAKGFQDVEAGKEMTTDSTLFRIASMSKPVTSVAVMILVDDGRLRVTDPVSKYLPEFKNPKVLMPGSGGDSKLAPASREITIHDLLSSTLPALLLSFHVRRSLSTNSITRPTSATGLLGPPSPWQRTCVDWPQCRSSISRGVPFNTACPPTSWAGW